MSKHDGQAEAEQSPIPPKLIRTVRSSSAALLSRFSPDSSPDNNDKTSQGELERNISGRAKVMKELPFRRSRSADYLAQAKIDADVSSDGQEPDQQEVRSRILHSEPERKRRMTFDQLKNKPLPKIAVL